MNELIGSWVIVICLIVGLPLVISGILMELKARTTGVTRGHRNRDFEDSENTCHDHAYLGQEECPECVELDKAFFGDTSSGGDGDGWLPENKAAEIFEQTMTAFRERLEEYGAFCECGNLKDGCRKHSGSEPEPEVDTRRYFYDPVENEILEVDENSLVSRLFKQDDVDSVFISPNRTKLYKSDKTYASRLIELV